MGVNLTWTRTIKNGPIEQSSRRAPNDPSFAAWKEFRKMVLQRKRDLARLKDLERGDSTETDLLLLREEARLHQELMETRKRGKWLGMASAAKAPGESR